MSYTMLKRSNKCCEDRISDLPDEILVKILSLLTLKEAEKSSVISSRWKTLWTFKTGNLDFDNTVALSQIRKKFSFQLLQNERDKYTNWVNQVLNSHQGPIIDLFKVRFNLDNTCNSHLDKWIQFALQKKTLNLVFDLGPRKTTEPNPYTFPKDIFFSMHSNLKILGSLQLCWVDLSGPVLQDILSTCTSLEALSIIGSNSLVDTKFNGSLKLKFIEIRSCKDLKTVQVSAANLESLVFCGEKDTSLRISYAPKLHIMYLGGHYCRIQYPVFPELSSVLSQIQTLVLDCTVLPFDGSWSSNVSQFPELKNIKCLHLMLKACAVKSLLYCITIIQACPTLHRFVVEFDWKMSRGGDQPRQMVKVDLEEKLESLKIVEFLWFSNRTSDTELVVSLLDNALNVETVIFDTHYQTTTSNYDAEKIDSEKYMMYRRGWAGELADEHSPNARLIVY